MMDAVVGRGRHQWCCRRMQLCVGGGAVMMCTCRTPSGVCMCWHAGATLSDAGSGPSNARSSCGCAHGACRAQPAATSPRLVADQGRACSQVEGKELGARFVTGTLSWVRSQSALHRLLLSMVGGLVQRLPHGLQLCHPAHSSTGPGLEPFCILAWGQTGCGLCRCLCLQIALASTGHAQPSFSLVWCLTIRPR